MDPIVSAIDRIKQFAGSTDQRIKAALRKRDVIVNDAARDPIPDPIDILKRLQRETFSDITKLRDRQDKVERILSSSKSVKGNLFQEASTRARGMVDVIGALFFASSNSQQISDTLMKAGIGTGIESWFIFETAVRQKDALIAQFVATNKSLAYHDEFLPSYSLALGKVLYLANITDCLSLVISPLGAQCLDFGLFSSSLQMQGLSTSGPPLFSEYCGCAAGLNIKRTYFSASLAELVTKPSDPARSSLATFGQFSCQPFEGSKVFLSGLWETPRSPFQHLRIGGLALPLLSTKHKYVNASSRPSSSGCSRSPKDTISGGSVAVMLDAEFDDFTRIGGWIQLQKTCPNNLQWSLSLSDTPDDELGWGLRVGGFVEGNVSQVHLEGFFKINLGERFRLQPGIIYAMNGKSQKPVLMLRSSWSL